jgi:esterase/lipase
MLEDGEIKVIESGIPVKVLIKGKSEDSVKKMIDETDLTNVKDKTKVEKLLRGQRGAFKGRINKFETERDELIREDEDNLRKKYTKEIEQYNKQIQETKKQLKVVNALINDLKQKSDMMIQQKK